MRYCTIPVSGEVEVGGIEYRNTNVGAEGRGSGFCLFQYSGQTMSMHVGSSGCSNLVNF